MAGSNSKYICQSLCTARLILLNSPALFLFVTVIPFELILQHHSFQRSVETVLLLPGFSQVIHLFLKVILFMDHSMYYCQPEAGVRSFFILAWQNNGCISFKILYTLNNRLYIIVIIFVYKHKTFHLHPFVFIFELLCC